MHAEVKLVGPGSAYAPSGNGTRIPAKGDRVEEWRTGIRRVGQVWYADELQVLVKWEDGRSSSLPLSRFVETRHC